MKMPLQVGGLSSVSGLSLPLGPVTRLSAGKAFHIHILYDGDDDDGDGDGAEYDDGAKIFNEYSYLQTKHFILKVTQDPYKC